MIIKKMDSKREELDEITSLLKGRLSPYQRFLLEREARSIKNGAQGEEDSAYYIDFYFGNSRNWTVIHDLRLEHQGQSAQIDHILINRFFDFYILESKNYTYGPDGHLKIPHLWPGQNPPGDSRRITYQ